MLLDAVCFIQGILAVGYSPPSIYVAIMYSWSQGPLFAFSIFKYTCFLFHVHCWDSDKITFGHTRILCLGRLQKHFKARGAQMLRLQVALHH